VTLEQLRIFIAVAEKQHVTQAAAALNLTQSATSAAIAALEARYGIKLFDRIGRGITLTQTGRDFFVEARAVLNRAKAATQVLDDLAGLKRGTLSIAASQTVANYWLPGRLLRFKSAHPGIDVRLSIANTQTVASVVRSGETDLGFVEGEVDTDDFDVQAIDGDALIVVVGKPHRWFGRRTIKPKDFARTRWILREQGSGTRAIFEDVLRRLGLSLSDLDIALELPSNESVRAAVEDSDCATAISELVAAPLLLAKALHTVHSGFPRRRFFALRLKDRYASAAERAFLTALDVS
jgi:DNA-binding transcriptional LysR family regulator